MIDHLAIANHLIHACYLHEDELDTTTLMFLVSCPMCPKADVSIALINLMNDYATCQL